MLRTKNCTQRSHEGLELSFERSPTKLHDVSHALAPVDDDSLSDPYGSLLLLLPQAVSFVVFGVFLLWQWANAGHLVHRHFLNIIFGGVEQVFLHPVSLENSVLRVHGLRCEVS